MSRRELAALAYGVLTALNLLALMLWLNKPIVQDEVVLHDRAREKCWAMTIRDNNLIGKPVECPER